MIGWPTCSQVALVIINVVAAQQCQLPNDIVIYGLLKSTCAHEK